MAEASMIGIFNNKVNAFNEAVKANDIDSICEVGADMLRIALEQCANPNVSTTLKDTYRKQCAVVINHLVRYAKQPPVAAAHADGGDEGGSDPYYTEKNWFSDEVPKLNFKNIIGVQEVKDAFMVDVVAPLRPEFQAVYHKFRGNQLGTQILLYGPPGTGKTHIVKCLAGALNCKIAVVQTSEVLASVVGVAEKNVRDIFAQAAELDRCIIFLDEIDSICSDRSSDDSRHTKSILTTMLTCMDGFMKTKKGLVVAVIVVLILLASAAVILGILNAIGKIKGPYCDIIGVVDCTLGISFFIYELYTDRLNGSKINSGDGETIEKYTKEIPVKIEQQTNINSQVNNGTVFGNMTMSTVSDSTEISNIISKLFSEK